MTLSATAPQRSDYPPGWSDEIVITANQFVAVLRDILHHEVGDDWDLYSDDPATEIERLRFRLRQVDAATREARRTIKSLQASARLAANRRASAERRESPSSTTQGA